ncbi:SUMF1/EgtB/PvdO family nonheme iron enzyme [Candidatus Venteria ishoeyi]|uniref:SUMF1/EgtB/PvdO family nonheme iron enzyme n=1 Tax=Candidatus Venteria ishoeyi TaxID=1899563 RepID=UPI0025A4F64E|nr:SUMF1/EgtB/PvdO family nonheme iron enzyme [Candidatus Venteria ishoeyi]MDM8547853.1 SUMF1/EgtB/PvdO family nonheme iron enzyme [Candidatus Venteria ishoeyi]
MSAFPPYRLAELQNFLEYLRAQGYPVGLGELDAAHRLLLGLYTAGGLPEADSDAHWRGLLRPLLCRSPQQQQDFDEHYQNWRASLVKTGEAAKKAPQQTPKPAAPRRSRRLLFDLAVLVLVLLCGLGLRLNLPITHAWLDGKYAQYLPLPEVDKPNIHDRITGDLLVSTPPAVNIKLQLQYLDGQRHLSAYSGETIRYLNPGRWRVTSPAGEYPEKSAEVQIQAGSQLTALALRLAPEPPKARLLVTTLPPTSAQLELRQMAQNLRRNARAGQTIELPAGRWQVSTHPEGYLAASKETTLQASQKHRLQLPLILKPPSPPEPKNWWQRYRYWLGGLAALLLVWLGIVLFRRNKLSRQLSYAGPELARLQLSVSGKRLYQGLALQGLAQQLHRHVPGAAGNLDVVATLKQSLEQLGLFSPVYHNAPHRPEYLVLVERHSGMDQQAQLVDSLLLRLRREGVVLDAWHFQGNPRWCYPYPKHGVNPERSHLAPDFAPDPRTPYGLDELAAHYEGRRLLLFGNGHGFVEHGLAAAWLARLSPWSERALFTLEPAGQWRYLENVLAQTGMLIYPASADGLGQFLHALDSAAPMAAEATLGHYPALLNQRPRRWLERIPPTAGERAELRQQLHVWLGNEGFIWLAACAIYPELHWPLTLHWGERLKLLDEERLAKLAVLPWLRHAYLPDWLRRDLLNALPWRLRHDLRGVFQTLLLRKQGDETVQTTLADPKRAPQRGRRTDQVCLGFLVGKLGLPLPAALLPKSDSEGKRMLKLGAAMLLLGAAAALFHFSPWRDALLDKWVEATAPHGEIQAIARLKLNTVPEQLQLSLKRGAQALDEIRTVSNGDSLWLRAGQYSYQAQAAGYQNASGSIRLTTEQKSMTLTIQLKADKKPGSDGVPDKIIDLARPAFRDTLKDGSPGPLMRPISAGSFLMGSPDKESGRQDDEGPQHRITLTQDFALGQNEVSFEEYDKFAEATGRDKPDDQGWGRGKRPVINVSWDNATAYAAWLSDQTRQTYVLPTEAQWEYAARAGTTTAYWWGNEVGQAKANCDGCGSLWDDKQTAPVGSFDANPFGLNDTSGNVWEWAADRFGDYSSDAQTNPGGPDKGSIRVIRGGSWGNTPRFVRSAYRNVNDPSFRSIFVGFRLARTNSWPSPIVPQMVSFAQGVTFMMGSEQGDKDEKSLHDVTLSPFEIGAYEVTNEEYVRLLNAVKQRGPKGQAWFETKTEDSRSQITGEAGKYQVEAGYEKHPVVNVSWFGAQAYIEWLNEQTAKDYRLPTEAEWEYAARGGTKTAYWWGDEASHDYANYGKDECCDGLAQGKDQWVGTAPVGSFDANLFGLYDTAGNVYEWTQDWYGSEYYKNSPKDNPTGPDKGSIHVIRGGSWNDTPRDVRSADRYFSDPSDRNGNVGFRLAR